MEENWAETELRGTKAADRRRVTSFIRTVEAIFKQPQLSLSAALGNGIRQAAGDLFQHMDTRVANVISAHVTATAERCRGDERVVVSQDTTYFTYGQDQIVGLGPLNGSAQGMAGHAALAISPDGVPLGVVALPRLRHVEQLSDPKARLNDLLRPASGLRGRRLKDFKPSARRVTGVIDDFSPLRALPAFRRFETELQNVPAAIQVEAIGS